MYTATLKFRKAPCNGESVCNLTKKQAERQVEIWQQQCGENNPYEPEYEITEEKEEQ